MYNTGLMIIISKEQIIKQDFTPISDYIGVAESTDVRHFSHTLHLQVDGYNFDPRELYMIPEVIAYFRTMLSKYPQVFYFLDKSMWGLVFLCGCVDVKAIAKDDARIKTVAFKIDKEQLQEVLKRNAYYKYLGNEVDLQRHIEDLDKFILSLGQLYKS